MKKTVAILLTCLYLAGCASYTPPTEFDPEQHARIRVFYGLHIPDTIIYIGRVCKKPGMPYFVAARNVLSSLVPNKTIGMPITEDMHTSSYHEYIIPAGNTITVHMARESVRRVYFVPEAGADYETYMRSERDGELIVNKLIVNADGSITKQKEKGGNYGLCGSGGWLFRKDW